MLSNQNVWWLVHMWKVAFDFANRNTTSPSYDTFPFVVTLGNRYTVRVSWNSKNNYAVSTKSYVIARLDKIHRAGIGWFSPTCNIATKETLSNILGKAHTLYWILITVTTTWTVRITATMMTTSSGCYCGISPTWTWWVIPVFFVRKYRFHCRDRSLRRRYFFKIPLLAIWAIGGCFYDICRWCAWGVLRLKHFIVPPGFNGKGTVWVCGYHPPLRCERWAVIKQIDFIVDLGNTQALSALVLIIRASVF